jgi:hypothetical protein
MISHKLTEGQKMNTEQQNIALIDKISDKIISEMHPTQDDDATIVAGVRAYADEIGKLVSPDGKMELPEKYFVCDGVHSLRKKLDELGIAFENLEPLRICSRKVEFGLAKFCADESTKIDISDICPAPLVAAMDNLRCIEAYFFEEKYLFVVKNPIAVRQKNGRMDSPEAPYIEFPDGGNLYAIEDVVCPQWVVEQKTATAEQIMGIEDVDVRAIAIRKFGAAPFSDGAKPIEKATLVGEDGTENEYKLNSLDGQIPGLDGSRYLQMDSRCSPGLRHVEGVEGDTVQEALDFRARIGLALVGGHWYPSSIDGWNDPSGDKNQMQQGDVCLARLPKDFDRSGYTQINGRGFVLSPENQRRHNLDGNFNLYENGESQILDCPEGCVLKHPEHGEKKIPKGAWLVFPTSEKDWIKDEIHVTID